MPDVHPTAIIADTVQLGAGTTVGPYAVIDANTVVGRNCRIGPHAVIGGPAQHRNAPHHDGWTVIGDDVVLREFVTINRATKPGRENATTVGDRCYFMASAHAGHDCRVANDVTLANAVLLGGHVTVGEHAFFGGGSGAHQFCRVGRMAVIHGVEGMTQDVPPFAAVKHYRVRGPNVVALRRNGFSSEKRAAIAEAYRVLRHHRIVSHALAALAEQAEAHAEVAEIVEFIRTAKRGIVPISKDASPTA